jgi:nucleotide-binding universal stress UspA family protein
MKALIAIDGSENALHALRYVVEHPNLFTSVPDLVLVNVHLPLPSARAKAVLGHEAVDQYYREEAEEKLAPARAVLVGKSCRSVERPIVGQPAEQIITTAQREGCDLIVIGTHGRGALGNLLMGSVAMRVIAESPIPVLSIRYVVAASAPPSL